VRLVENEDGVRTKEEVGGNFLGRAGREGGRKGGREGGREGSETNRIKEREGSTEGRREGGREEGHTCSRIPSVMNLTRVCGVTPFVS
jgi:hypothetical protein